MTLVQDYAFPFEHHQKFSLTNPMITCQGLSKREYIAALVLQGLLSNPQIDLSQLAGAPGVGLVQNAIYMADQLIRISSPVEDENFEPLPDEA